MKLVRNFIGVLLNKVAKTCGPAGTITQNWSGTAIEYQKLLSTVDWRDFSLTGKMAVELRDRRTYIGRVVEESWVNYTTIAISAAATAACIGLALARKGSSLL